MWLPIAIAGSLCEALKDVFSKKSLVHVDEYILLWFSRVVSVFFLLPFLILSTIPRIEVQMLQALLISGTINVVAVIFYFKAIKNSDLSLVLPMLAFTPLFLLITSPLIIGEFPKVFGLIGVVLIVIGSYTLNIKKRHKGYFAPFTSLVKESGTRYMLLVALLWSISSNFDKIGIVHSSALFWTVAVNGFIAIVLSPMVVFRFKPIFHLIRIHKRIMILSGIFLSMSVLLIATAMSMSLVSYAVSVKRTSILWGAFLGYVIFKEKNLQERIAGAVIMIIGVIFISISS